MRWRSSLSGAGASCQTTAVAAYQQCPYPAQDHGHRRCQRQRSWFYLPQRGAQPVETGQHQQAAGDDQHELPARNRPARRNRATARSPRAARRGRSCPSDRRSGDWSRSAPRRRRKIRSAAPAAPATRSKGPSARQAIRAKRQTPSRHRPARRPTRSTPRPAGSAPKIRGPASRPARSRPCGGTAPAATATSITGRWPQRDRAARRDRQPQRGERDPVGADAPRMQPAGDRSQQVLKSGFERVDADHADSGASEGWLNVAGRFRATTMPGRAARTRSSASRSERARPVVASQCATT
jgi:hypothetical protein